MPQLPFVFRLIPSPHARGPIRIWFDKFPELRGYAEEGERLVIVPTADLRTLTALLQEAGARVEIGAANNLDTSRINDFLL